MTGCAKACKPGRPGNSRGFDPWLQPRPVYWLTITVVLLGRLAIDKTWQRRGLGRALFRDASLRVSHAAEAIGVRGIVVHAISDEARKFHLALGFTECAGAPMTLVVTLQDVRAGLGLV